MRVRLHPYHVLRHNKMLTCAGADRLQTGMRHAFGKPCGVCARVSIGQVLLSIRCRESHIAAAHEALRRAKFKFPGRQEVIECKNWGFSPYSMENYITLKKEGRLFSSGSHAKLYSTNGMLSTRRPGTVFLPSFMTVPTCESQTSDGS